jgi:hypothetical protein
VEKNSENLPAFTRSVRAVGKNFSYAQAPLRLVLALVLADVASVLELRVSA